MNVSDGCAMVAVRASGKPVTHAKARLVILSVLAAALAAIAVFAPSLCPYDPNAQDLSAALQAPSALHPMGTDRFGRDVLSRVIVAAQPSILLTLALVSCVATLGTVVGVASAWGAKWFDSVAMRVTDGFLAFPRLVFAIAVAAVFGGGMQNAVLALVLVSWPKYARLARSMAIAQKHEPYMDAARLSGCGTLQLLWRHLLPNIAGTLLVTAMLDIGTMMMELAGLSFLGLGAQPPLAEWGSMMSADRSLLQTAPWTVFAPGLAIFFAVMVFNLLGDTLRDWLAPELREDGGRDAA